MALDIILAQPAAYTTTISLRAETCTLSIKRTPIATALPGGTTLQIDLGMVLRELTIVGLCSIDERNSLETAAMTWYTGGYVRLQELTYDGLFNRYYGQIRNVDFRREAGLDERYNFSLNFQIQSKV